nr:unnamed protein product [Callosobruchus analis]
MNQMSSTEHVSNDDLLIPLYRTKVCSSLQLDVERAPSRMRNEGIKHDDKSIASYFKKLGVDKLLRACRPVKCARKAILNEPSKKCLPYSPSLKSLPLDETDLDIINQSLEMSITRSRTSTSFIKKPVLSKPDRCSVR